MPTPAILNVQSRLKKSNLYMDTPDFVIAAAEFLSNRGDELHKDTIGFLATRVENDTKVY